MVGRFALLVSMVVCACGKVNGDTPVDANLTDADQF
jgi:hypothetical protein